MNPVTNRGTKRITAGIKAPQVHEARGVQGPRDTCDATSASSAADTPRQHTSAYLFRCPAGRKGPYTNTQRMHPPHSPNPATLPPGPLCSDRSDSEPRVRTSPGLDGTAPLQESTQYIVRAMLERVRRRMAPSQILPPLQRMHGVLAGRLKQMRFAFGCVGAPCQHPCSLCN